MKLIFRLIIILLIISLGTGFSLIVSAEEAGEPDTTAPVITLLGNETMSLVQGIPFTEPGYKSNDNTDGNITSKVVKTGVIDVNKIGDYKITYTSTDKAGNKSTAIRIVTVTAKPDTAAPEIILKGDQVVTIIQDSLYNEEGYSASDDTDGDISELVTVTGNVDTTLLGSCTLLYEVSDKAGNKAAKSRIVVIIPNPDVKAPVISLNGDVIMTLNQEDIYFEPGFTATDDVDGDITGKVSITNMPDTSIAMVYTVLYTISDKAGNSVSVTRLVNVIPVENAAIIDPPMLWWEEGNSGSSQDIIPPMIYLNGSSSMVLRTGSLYKEPGAVAFDDIDGDVTDISSQIIINGEVFTDSAGTYTILYQVSDEAGNTAVVTRTVQVIDNLMLSERKPYDFSGTFKKNTPPFIHKITADESGIIDAMVTINNNGSGENIGIINATLKDFEGNVIISKQSTVSFSMSADVSVGEYTLEIEKSSGKGAEYKAYLLMPEIWYEQIGESNVPLAGLPFDDNNFIIIITGVIILLLAIISAIVIIIKIKKRNKLPK